MRRRNWMDTPTQVKVKDFWKALSLVTVATTRWPKSVPEVKSPHATEDDSLRDHVGTPAEMPDHLPPLICALGFCSPAAFGNEIHLLEKKKNMLEIAIISGNEAAIKYWADTKAVEDPAFNISTNLLSLAAEAGQARILEALLERSDIDINDTKRKSGINVDCKDQKGSTPLCLAAKRNFKSVARLLLDRDQVDVNCRDRKRRTPLWYAVYLSNIDVVKLLLSRRDADVNFRCDYRQSLLCDVVSSLDTEMNTAILELLLQRDDLDINENRYGKAPLELAITNNNTSAVRLLLTRSDIRFNFEGTLSVIHRAAEESTPEILKLLLDHDGARIGVDARDQYGCTALSWAAFYGRTEIVKLLLGRNDVDINSRDYQQQTPLILAASQGEMDVVRLLANTNGIDKSCIDDGGWTAYDHAVRSFAMA
ncbi:hypothetical protein AJ79_03545 [Helicocarpus griseus UAMH5409]|uniref:Uncharacterized protein n=1 Tax=Helicocarpus griseus UAMH5409 TaxID=1447875 RepID=A0A2B7XY52_9EURO|nr:hypothetical protein AJ79_03545 [Helicocarpus griseus UAMH5409]